MAEKKAVELPGFEQLDLGLDSIQSATAKLQQLGATLVAGQQLVQRQLPRFHLGNEGVQFRQGLLVAQIGIQPGFGSSLFSSRGRRFGHGVARCSGVEGKRVFYFAKRLNRGFSTKRPSPSPPVWVVKLREIKPFDRPPGTIMGFPAHWCCGGLTLVFGDPGDHV